MSINYEALYRAGVIGPFYLFIGQLQLYKMLKSKKRVYANCHRRMGKGSVCYLHCVEECIRRRINVRVGAPTQLQAFSIFDFLLTKIFYKAPHLKPKRKNGVYEFENGSKITLFGVADSSQLDRARGTDSDIIVCDEYAFWAYKAEYTLKSILMPQLLNNAGQLIVTSTPPEDLTHYYIDLVHKADLDGNLFNWTILDSVRVGDRTEEEHQRIIEDTGGIDTEAYKREYLCKLIPSSERLVLPECQNEELFIGKQDRPPHLDSYVVIDLGFIDYTAALFAYLDFKESRIIVLKELMVNHTTTSSIIEGCKKIESDLSIEPFIRLGDCSDRQQIHDMTVDHDYVVNPITKRSSQSNVGFRDSVLNQLRMGVKDGKILIDPDGCPNLIKQMKFGIWDERRKDFQRTESMGHLDCMMAMAYLFDNVQWTRNPYPHKYAGLTTTEHFIKEEYLNIDSKPKLGTLIGRR